MGKQETELPYALTLERVIGNYHIFVDDLLRYLEQVGIDVKDYPIDHLCYRVTTKEEYESMKISLMGVSDAYLESTHHNRPYSKFILKESAKVGKYDVPVVELPSPKEGSSYRRGLEHFEFVVGDDYEHILKEYNNLWTEIDDSGPYNQPLNITFPNGFTVKFHRHSLIDVIQMEGNQFITINS